MPPSSYKVRSFSDHAEHARQFRDALGAYPTGVAIVCARHTDGRCVGLTINSFASVSLDPPLILWSLANGSESMDAFAVGKPFTLTILSEAQEDVARLFARDGVDRFKESACFEAANGVPIVEGGAAYFECVVHAVHDGGDHRIIVGRVARFGESKLSSLVFHKGMFRPL